MHSEQRTVVESGGRLTLIVVAIMLATLMQTLDTTIVNVALPIIQGNLGATIDEGAWVVTGYIVSAVIVIPLTPWLQSRFGRRQYYSTAILGFTIASVFCGFATSIDSLIFWRVVQGLFGGGLVATAQATLRDTFPPSRLGASQAIFALGAIVGPTVGPTLGGYLTDNFSWNYVFFINIIPGLVAFAIIVTQLKNPSEGRPVPLDYTGLGLLAMGLGSLQYILDEGQRNDWFADEKIRFFATTAAIGIGAFVPWELWGTKKRPVVDVRAFKFRAIAAGALMSFAIGASLFGSTVILPQYVQSLLDFTATLSGLLIFVRAIVLAVFTILAARLAGSGRVDTRYLLLGGFLLVALSNAMLSFVTTTVTPFWTFAPSLIVSGLGLAMLFTPLSIAVQGGVPREQSANASAFTSLSLQLGGSFSTAALVTILARRNAFHQDHLAAAATHANPAVNQFLAEHGTVGQLTAIVMQQASALSYADASMFLAVGTLILAPLAFVLPKPKPVAGAAIAVE